MSTIHHLVRGRVLTLDTGETYVLLNDAEAVPLDDSEQPGKTEDTWQPHTLLDGDGDQWFETSPDRWTLAHSLEIARGISFENLGKHEDSKTFYSDWSLKTVIDRVGILEGYPTSA